MNKSEFEGRLKELAEACSTLRVKLALKDLEPPKKEAVTITKFVPKYWCEHTKGGMPLPSPQKKEKKGSQNQQQILETKVGHLHDGIRAYRRLLGRLVDVPVWQRTILKSDDPSFSMCGCYYCDAHPVEWEKAFEKFPHDKACPWGVVEKRALVEEVEG